MVAVMVGGGRRCVLAATVSPRAASTSAAAAGGGVDCRGAVGGVGATAVAAAVGGATTRNKSCRSLPLEEGALQPPSPTVTPATAPSCPPGAGSGRTGGPPRRGGGGGTGGGGKLHHTSSVTTTDGGRRSHHLPTSMEADTGDYQGRESAPSLSPQGAAIPLSPSSPYYDNPTSPISPGGSRRREPKQCGVCWDVAKSNHFGGLSCDSCKAFFRRSVQNNAYKAFSCPYEKNCVIAKASRKACQYCRFNKCESIGMEKGWVMSEEERRKMMESRQGRRNASSSLVQAPSVSPAVADAPSIVLPSSSNDRAAGDALASGSTSTLIQGAGDFQLSEEMMNEIERIEKYYQQSYNVNPYNSKPSGSKGVLDTWMQFCKKIGHFFSLFTYFSSLSEMDQGILLKTAIPSAGIIMGSVTSDSWIGSKPNSDSPGMPKISFENIERLVPGDLLYRVKTFFEKFKVICPDKTMAKILVLVSLYAPELAKLENVNRVQELQEHYINMLDCYIKYNYRDSARNMFANVLVSLADVRELAERSLEMEINRSVMSEMLTASSDPSSGGDGSERKGSSGRGSFDGPSSGGGNGSSNSGGLASLSGGTASGYSGGNAGSSNDGGNSSDNGSCGDNFNTDGPANPFFNYPMAADEMKGPAALHHQMASSSPVTPRNNSSLFLSMDTDDRSALGFSTTDGPDPSPGFTPESPSTNPAEAKKLTKRQLSDLRIQELFKSIPPPAVMKIICHMSEDLDIETKKTEGGFKFLRKQHGPSNSFDEEAVKPVNSSGARRRSSGAATLGIKTEAGPVLEPSYPLSFMETQIKEEKMDVDVPEDPEIDEIKMFISNLDTSVEQHHRQQQQGEQQQQQQQHGSFFDALQHQSADVNTTNQHNNNNSSNNNMNNNRIFLEKQPHVSSDEQHYRQQSYANQRHHHQRRHHHHHHHQHHSRHSRYHHNNGHQSNNGSSSSNRLGSVDGVAVNTNNGGVKTGQLTSPPPPCSSYDSRLAAVPSRTPDMQQQQQLVSRQALRTAGATSLSVHIPATSTLQQQQLMQSDLSSVPSHILPDVPGCVLNQSSAALGPAAADPHRLLHSPSLSPSGGGGGGVIGATSTTSSDTQYLLHSSTGGHQSSITAPAPPSSVSPKSAVLRHYPETSDPSCLPSAEGHVSSGYLQANGVQQQIMAMSIHSPGSPNDNSNSSIPSSNGGGEDQRLMTQFSGGYFTQFCPRQSPPQQQQQQQIQQQQVHGLHSFPSHSRAVDDTPTFSVNTSSAPFLPDKLFLSNSKDGDMSSFSNPSTPTPLHLSHCRSSSSPSPITAVNSSSSSNSSPENSKDSFDRCLHTLPPDLSCLSDGESAVLQMFFEHINMHLSQHMHEGGKPWNSEDLLPKPFLAMLQAKLKTDFK